MPISSSATGLRPGVCTSTTRPTAPYEGQMIYETDTNRVLVYEGAAWVMIADTDSPPGLELIKVQTWASSVMSVTVSNVFSSTYENYRIVIYANDASGTSSHSLQLSGITGSGYFTGGSYGAWGSATQVGYGSSASTVWIASANNAPNQPTQITCEIAAPNLARRKHGTLFSQAGSGHASFNLLCTSTSAATGFVLSKFGETMTGGSIHVYGYRNTI
jgi:hypothetical protein